MNEFFTTIQNNIGAAILIALFVYGVIHTVMVNIRRIFTDKYNVTTCEHEKVEEEED